MHRPATTFRTGLQAWSARFGQARTEKLLCRARDRGRQIFGSG